MAVTSTERFGLWFYVLEDLTGLIQNIIISVPEDYFYALAIFKCGGGGSI